MEFSFAHLSDVHLGPLPDGAMWRDFALKRVLGGLSWQLRRRKVHDPAVADAILADIRASNPDHIAFTGDLLNISAYAEFQAGLAWLARLGDADTVTFTPGNHDAYVAVDHARGLGLFAPYMTGNFKRVDSGAEAGFPFVRLRRNVAFVGLNSACPQRLHRAGGTLGSDQIARLATALRSLKSQGFYRAVLIHHPPLPGLAKPRKALSDAAELVTVLKSEGADLVLHGHNHRAMYNSLAADGNVIPIHGVPSASSNGRGHIPPAEWHLYTVDRSKGRWRTMVKVRSYSPVANAFQTTNTFELHPNAANV